MDLREIVNRPDTLTIGQDEAVFLISRYIKDRKGIEVTPIIRYTSGMIALVEAVPYAIAWYRENPDRI